MRFHTCGVFVAWFLVALRVAVAAEAQTEPLRYTDVLRLPDQVTLATLSNGLTVIVQENHVAPVATVRCFVKNTGSAYEGKNLGAGFSHVLEHVVAGGSTTHHSEKEIEKIVDTFGGATNAFTSTDMTTFFIDCPAKNTMTAIGLMADSMQHITFEPEEFARELKVVRRELADDEVDRQHVLWKLLQQTVYTTHPARHPIIGYLEVLNGTTNQTIIDFYHERYMPNNQVFVVVGDVGTQQVLDEVAKQYAGTPRGRETYVAFEDEPRAAFAARGDHGDGRGHLRSGAGLAHRKAFASRSCTRWTGRLHSRRRGKLAAGPAVEVREAGGAGGQRHQRHAALRGWIFRRHGRQPAGNVADRPPKGILHEVYRPARRVGWPRGAGQGQEAEGGRV